MKRRKHRHTDPYDSQTLTRAVTHIRLEATNAGKLAALDDLAQVYLPLCQQYVTLFCTDERPNKLRAPLFATPLSERWQRVAIQQAAGIAQSWRTKTTPMTCWPTTSKRPRAIWMQRQQNRPGMNGTSRRSSRSASRPTSTS